VWLEGNILTLLMVSILPAKDSESLLKDMAGYKSYALI
jgi:hypothetical protein